MPSRYENRITAVNNDDKYDSFFKERNVKFIEQFRTAKLNHPTARQIGNLTLVAHMWGVGDRYWKLAFKHYGSEDLWWVVAWFNQRPTEAHVRAGDVIQIPLPLDKVLGYLDP